MLSALAFALAARTTMIEPGRELKFIGYKGLELVGTFQPGTGSGKRPAVLILAGSGPTDRDGNSGLGVHTDLLKQIAENMASHGISTFRYDKRATVGYRDKFPKDIAGLGAFFSWKSFLEDAKAGYRAMMSQPNADPNHGGIAGHSEGGMIAIAIAQDLNPQAVVLLSTPGRDLGTLIQEQVANSYHKSGLSDDVQHQAVADTDRIVNAIRSTGKVPADVPPQLKPVFPAYIGGYFQSTFLFIPSSEVAHLNSPVLIVQGAKDIQVSPDRDEPLLAANAKNPTVFMVQGASHNLKVLKSASDMGFDGPVAPGLLDKVSDWVNGHI